MYNKEQGTPKSEKILVVWLPRLPDEKKKQKDLPVQFFAKSPLTPGGVHVQGEPSAVLSSTTAVSWTQGKGKVSKEVVEGKRSQARVAPL